MDSQYLKLMTVGDLQDLEEGRKEDQATLKINKENINSIVKEHQQLENALNENYKLIQDIKVELDRNISPSISNSLSSNIKSQDFSSSDENTSKVKKSHRRSAAIIDDVQLTSNNSLLPKPKLRYKTWIGGNQFLLNGILVSGAHLFQFFISLIILYSSWIIFGLTILPYYLDKRVKIIGLLLMYINIVTLFATTFTEPGIYPKRKRVLYQNVDFLHNYFSTNYKNEYCVVCGILHLNTHITRVRHCKYCNNCVDIFDHHCPWTGNCIGRRNYFPYFILLAGLILSSIYYFLLSSYLLICSGFNVPTNYIYLRIILGALVTIWSLIVMFLIGSLFFFHCYLIIKQVTTSEYFRNKKIEQNESDQSNKLEKRFFSLDNFLVLNECGLCFKSLSCHPRDIHPPSSCNKTTFDYQLIISTLLTSPTHEIKSKNDLKSILPNETRLLPMWHYESDEDLEVQEEISQYLQRKYNEDMLKTI